MDSGVSLAIGGGAIAVLFAVLLTIMVLRLPQGTQRMIEIAAAIQEGASAYLNRQYLVIAIIGVIIALVIGVTLGWVSAVLYVVGAACSATAGYVGMNVSVRANLRTAQAAQHGLSRALATAFRGGAVTGFMVVGLGLLGVAVSYRVTHNLDALVALGFGASLVSVFARLGGGIYTKAADVGADLVGKVEAGIPEDDPRNPAVIADNVGDNVGDCAGMAADLFETYVVTTVAAMLLGNLVLSSVPGATTFPLILGAISIVASIIGTFFVGIGKVDRAKIMNSLYVGLGVAGILSAIVFYWITVREFGPGGITVGTGAAAHTVSPAAIWGCAAIGLAVTGLITWITEYYTGTQYSPVRRIASASITGHATNIISGLAVSMQATALPGLVIVAGILGSYALVGLYGVGIAVMAMLSMAGIVVAIDSFGPITDNAGGIAEMADLPADVRGVTDPLDAVGNTTKAVTKGYAIGSAGLAAIVLFASFLQELGNRCTEQHLACAQNTATFFTIDNPFVLAGLLIGGMLPFFFSSLSMEAVGRAGGKVVENVRMQFKNNPGIMAGTSRPDYASTVDIVTRAALKEMVVPALIPVGVPVVVVILGAIGVFRGIAAAQIMGGILVGAIVTGLFLAIAMTSGGGAWDNAKKYIEDGHNGGKGSDAHKAAVTGDTVGDPYKDTAGPAINPMIKVLNIVALLLVAYLVR